MFKRISVLLRREGDSLAQFSEGWLRHGELIRKLPGVRGYLQNHVVASYTPPHEAPLIADGFVELRFDTPDAMAAAFSSPAARTMAEDEPNFLGHGSGYALKGDDCLREASEGAKLVIALPDDRPQMRAAQERNLSALCPVDLLLDEVVDLIAKPGMSPPQPARLFWHVHFSDANLAHLAAQKIVEQLAVTRTRGSVFRVRTIKIV